MLSDQKIEDKARLVVGIYFRSLISNCMHLVWIAFEVFNRKGIIPNVPFTRKLCNMEIISYCMYFGLVLCTWLKCRAIIKFQGMCFALHGLLVVGRKHVVMPNKIILHLMNCMAAPGQISGQLEGDNDGDFKLIG